jgi:CubicO group peptidase (beta-lactamase class C family)
MKALPTIFILFLFSCHSNSQDLEQSFDNTFGKLISEGKLHGCVTYVQQGDDVLHFKAYGYQNIEEKQPMEKEAIFLIASMTKVVTAAGALKLYEEGKFLLDDPVKLYLKQFENMAVLENIGTDSAKIVPPTRDVTIRDLFRHTAGFGYAYKKHADNDTIDNLYVDNELWNSGSSTEFLDKICSYPLKYHPGSKWQYSYSIDILGFLVEKISGMTLHDYLTKEILEPLQMTSTGFYVSPENLNRLSCNYEYKNGQLELIDNPGSSPFGRLPNVFSGGGGLEDNVGGLVTTAEDFANFCTMIMNYGQFGDRRILKKQTVELMISDQIAAIHDREFQVSGYGFGTGVAHDIDHGGAQAVFWAGGPVNTYFRIDMEKNLISIFLTQNSPWRHENLMGLFGEIVAAHTG